MELSQPDRRQYSLMTKRSWLTAVAVAIATIQAATPPASGHTDSDLVAVPAGAEAVVRLQPTHGCGDSPTTGVAIRVPIEDATPVAVPGWTASATDDGAGRTVVEWTGGSLPSEQSGAFPVEFTTPELIGELLLFPAVQVCANGEELSWISGDPTAEYPAPRLLVLAPGSAPAASLDEVALDAPGRELVVEVVPGASDGEPTTTPPSLGDPDPPPDDEAPAANEAAAVASTAADGGSATDTSTTPIVVGSVVAVGGLAALGGLAIRKRRSSLLQNS